MIYILKEADATFCAVVPAVVLLACGTQLKGVVWFVDESTCNRFSSSLLPPLLLDTLHPGLQ